MFVFDDREWEHEQSDSDTLDTDSSNDTGGDGFFSHGNTSLSHQHWADQVISAGSFNLHDTQAAEADHKTSMGLASLRVRHFDPNTTQSKMLSYLCRHTTFEQLKQKIPELNPPLRSDPKYQTGVLLPLLEAAPGRGGTRIVEMGEDLAAVNTQKRFLHPEVRVARVEIMDLVCDALGISKTRRSYAALGKLTWSFGQVCFAPNTLHQIGCFICPKRVYWNFMIGCFSVRKRVY